MCVLGSTLGVWVPRTESSSLDTVYKGETVVIRVPRPIWFQRLYLWKLVLSSIHVGYLCQRGRSVLPIVQYAESSQVVEVSVER